MWKTFTRKTPRPQKIHGQSLKESEFLNRNAPDNVNSERLRPRTLSYFTGHCGSALKLSSSKFSAANNLWPRLFQKLTNCSHSTYQQCQKFLNLRYFLGVIKNLKLSKSNGAFQPLPLYFSAKFTTQSTEEELWVCFIIKRYKN